MLLVEKNLKYVPEHPQSFVIPVFPWLALPTLVLDEHFFLKELSFYEVVRLANVEAQQARLDERTKKMLGRDVASGSYFHLWSNFKFRAPPDCEDTNTSNRFK